MNERWTFLAAVCRPAAPCPDGRCRSRLVALVGMTALVVPVGVVVGAASASAVPTYAVTATVAVGDEPGGGGRRRHHQHHLRGQLQRRHVSVIDGANNTVTATIPVDHEPEWGGRRRRHRHHLRDQPPRQPVSVINGTTNTVTATIPVGTNPDGVAVDAATDTIYVANYKATTRCR